MHLRIPLCLRLLASFGGGEFFGLRAQFFELVPGFIQQCLHPCAALTLPYEKPQEKEADGADCKDNN